MLHLDLIWGKPINFIYKASYIYIYDASYIYTHTHTYTSYIYTYTHTHIYIHHIYIHIYIKPQEQAADEANASGSQGQPLFFNGGGQGGVIAGCEMQLSGRAGSPWATESSCYKSSMSSN